MSFFRALPHAIRTLLRSPGFSAVVIIILALGIAANTTIFTLVDQLLLNPFPYRDAKQLVMVWEANPSLGGITAKRVPAPWVNFEAWRSQSHSFDAIEAYAGNLGFNLTGVKTPERLIAARATPGFFPMLGITVILGRTFAPGDDVPGGNPLVILTYGFWSKHYGRNNPVGEKLLLDGVPYTVIGVLPKEFHLPAIFEGISEYKPDIWVPLATVAANDWQTAKWRRLRVCARLKSGVSLAQASDDLRTIEERRAKDDPELNRGYGISIFPLEIENTDPDLRNELRVFSCAAVLVLLLACASLAGLMLVRTAAQGRKIAVMAALGARRWALVAPVLGESCVLAMMGGISGFLLAYAGIHLVAVLKPSDIHAPERLTVNLHAFAFAAAVSALTILIFGLIPAWLASRTNVNDVLKSGRTDVTLPQGRSFTRASFLAIQIAVALVLAIASALLIRSFQHVLALDQGFSIERVLTAHLSLPAQRYPTADDRTRFCRLLRDRLQAIPGVESAALIDNLPMYAIRYTSFEIEGRPILQRSAAPSADNAYATPDFFRTMKIPLKKGRLFTDQDAEASPPAVVIINETLARQHWPNQEPVGSHIRELPTSGPPGPWQTVIGVVGDFRQFNPTTAARPELVWPGKTFSSMSVVVRTTSMDPLALSSALEQALWSIDRDEPLSDVQTLEQIVSDYNSQRKFNTLTLSAFASLSILLMLVGMYGLISSFISAHIRDIGIRFALGAGKQQVCLALLLPALPPVVAGIVLGLILSFAAKRVLESVLFHVSALDPATYATAPVALLAALLLASLAATLRAARVDPAVVLREQ